MSNNRLRQIEQLVLLAGFNPTELSRLDNSVLEKTYQAAIPMIQAKRDALGKVYARENRLSRAKRHEIERNSHQRQQELEWSQKWVNPKSIPICTVAKSEEQEVLDLIRESEARRRHFSSLFRTTGKKEYATAANDAMMANKTFTEQLRIMRQEARS